MTRRKEHGGAMMVTLIIILVLLAGASMLVSIEVNSTRSTGITRTGMTAMYCAEAGLTAARQVVANNQLEWAGASPTPGSICTNPDHTACAEPGWLQSSFVHDLDGDTDIDVKVVLVDNDDEFPVPDATKDSDRRIFIVAQCLTFPEATRAISELVEASGGESCADQEGDCGGTGVVQN
jgi:hypothetical protein